MAATMPTASAPWMPACSKAGANASAVAGPPAKVAVPVSTPNSGGRPSAVAMPMPSRPCATARPAATPRNNKTCWPPARSSGKLAPKPSEVKNATSSGVLRVLSNAGAASPAFGRSKTPSATTNPPSTAAGRFSLARTGRARRSPSPATKAKPARVRVCMASIPGMLPPRAGRCASPLWLHCHPSCGRSTC